MANKIQHFFIVTFIMVIGFLFIRAFYFFHLEYKSSINGLVSVKSKGSRGSNYVTIKNNLSKKSQTYDFQGMDELYSMINIGDSCCKFSNSYYVFFYPKKNQFAFKDSFEFWHY